MVHVVALSNPPRKNFAVFFHHTLEKWFAVNYYGTSDLLIHFKQPEFVICSGHLVHAIELDDGIAVFSKDYEPADTFSLDSRCIAVVDSSNTALIEKLSQCSVRAITCGFSPKDTLTISSLTDDSAVISLQRSITTFSGSIVEPVEFPIHLTHHLDSFILLSLACVLILSDHADLLTQLDL